MAIWVPFANGEGDTLLVSYNDDPEGVYEGDTVLVAGEFAGFFTGENVSGVEWTWPVIKAVFVELVPPGEG